MIKKNKKKVIPPKKPYCLHAGPTLDILCLTPYKVRKLFTSAEANSGPPFEVSTSGMPKVVNISLRLAIRPLEPLFSFLARLTSGQFVHLSTEIRYGTPLRDI